MRFTRAVPDPYALYHIVAGHTAQAALLRNRAGEGSVVLIVTAFSLVSAGAMPTCGDDGCGREHPDDLAALLRDFMRLGGVRYHDLPPESTVAAGALYRRQVQAHYVGDTVAAACAAATVAQAARAPLLTTQRSWYLYATGILDALAPRIELD
jgi:hypothetical protein